jgi:biotin synthase
MLPLNDILNQDRFSLDDLVRLLSVTTEEEKNWIWKKGLETKQHHKGHTIRVRGLIELSNICMKNCRYCGIRKGNRQVRRYNMPDRQVLEVALKAISEGYTALVIQSGERTGEGFTGRIDRLVRSITQLSGNRVHITLSCGEQSLDTYRRWHDSGAYRYLLRIETTNRELFRSLHPDDDFDTRLQSLEHIREAGFQVGSGVMIGLPGQTVEDLARDLLFLKESGVQMVGMGPYVEHKETPLYTEKDLLWSQSDRLEKTLLMTAILRLLMPGINIAAGTALDALHPEGRALALSSGANVLMPNITPFQYREGYLLYHNKPCHVVAADLIQRIQLALPKGEVIDHPLCIRQDPF